MITPEFVNEQPGEYLLIANHFVGTPESLQMSIAFNKARIEFAKVHLPKQLSKCILHYDLRGQVVSNTKVKEPREAFSDIHEIRILTN